MDIILASASPRRKEILTLLGINFKIIVSDCDENTDITLPEELVRELSLRKALSVKEKCSEDSLIIGCDTVVAIDGKILGKPKTKAHAKKMLKELNGRTHSVFSGLTLICGDKVLTEASETLVEFDTMSETEINTYIETGDPMDKAGAYGIQGYVMRYIKGIHGDYQTVVGFPANLFHNMLKELDISL